MCCVKISILLLFLRIFPAKQFRMMVYGVMAFVVTYGVASIVATIVQCSPVARIWDKAFPGSCIDLTVFWYANAAASIVGDFLTLILPIPVVKQLQLPPRQKMGLMLVFAVGSL